MKDRSKLELTGVLYIGHDNDLHIDVEDKRYIVAKEINNQLNICNYLGDKAKVKITIEVLEGL